ncbi:MAG: transglutaminase family protein [Gammaproteobacteria bacterium]
MINYNLPLQSEFQEFKHLNQSFLVGAILLSRLINEHTDTAWVMEEITRLSLKVGISDAPQFEILRALRSEGFCGATDYYTYSNSAIETVLKTKKGIPISLAVVVMAIGDQLQIKCHGINFPGHFLVKVNGLLIDPFTMKSLDSGLMQDWLHQSGVPEKDAFKIAKPIDLLLRMLNNLRALAVAQEDFNKALDFSAYQLLLVDEPFVIHLGRIDLWDKAGLPSMAKKEIEFALALAPSQEYKIMLNQRLASLDIGNAKLH